MKSVRVETDQRGVATMVLARPEKRNALSPEMMDAISRAAQQLDVDPSVRVVVLASEGETFCAGGDLEWMRRQMSAQPVERREEAFRLASMLSTLNNLRKPLIARVQGDAFGGALGLLSVSDAVIACSTARFGLTETRLGLIPATIGPYVLAKIGAGAARRYFISPRVFAACEAMEIGLVSRVVSADALDTVIEDEVRPLLTAAPGAVTDAKLLLSRLLSANDLESAVEASVDALVHRWESDEVEEGTRAFFERRKPNWTVD